MDSRGGCCIASFTGGAGTYHYDMSKADHIMLRFRPIAPKPTSDGSGGKPVSSGESGGGSSDVSVKGGRKRKCQPKENSGNARSCTPRRRSDKSIVHGGHTKVTLSLLPETPDKGAFTDLKVRPGPQGRQSKRPIRAPNFMGWSSKT